jgi:uncharacterized protein YfkK (UPF0435 family)
MIEKSYSQAKDAQNEKIKKAAYNNLIFFGVAGKLLEIEIPKDVPEEVKEKIDLEVKLIEAHQGIVGSHLFGYKEDYSQYIPRGHYTRNIKFEQYFKAMMWYGRMGFYIRPPRSMYLGKVDIVKEGIKLTRQAILITKIIKENPDLAKLWESIYEPTTFFVGKADEFTVKEYENILKNVDPANDNSILLFIKRVEKLPGPKIVSVVTRDSDTLGLRGFKFMGQRFIPDSYIFQNLVYPKVGKYLGENRPFTLENTMAGPMRCFPRGLDVMYVFGSEVAGDILKAEGDTEYEKYKEQVRRLINEFKYLPESQWNENLYWRWLWILKKLVTHPHIGYPAFMQTHRWQLKQLNAALGSWAELRHDTILYGKQSYTLVGLSAPTKRKLREGWVEPYPEIYRLIKELVLALIKKGEYPEEVKEKILQFSNILEKLAIISDEELKNKLISEKEYQLIRDIGTILKEITKFSPSLMRKITSGADEEMAVIADVHTDPNSGKVLEEAVGYPYEIYVKLPGGKIVRGGIFSYYEFKAPLEERYTDEKWQEELKTAPPKPPKWFLTILEN